MAEPKVTALASVEIGVRDVDAATRFFTEIWGLDVSAEDGGSRYFRGTGSQHHILTLHPRSAAQLIRLNLSAADSAAVDGLHAKAQGVGATILSAPGTLAGPGGGYGFDFTDREGRILRVEAGVDTLEEIEDKADRPLQLAHVVLNSADADGASDFFVDTLGFTLSDQTRMFNFLRCNACHHSVAFAYNDDATLNHIAFDMPDLDSVMRGAGRLLDHDYPIEWGVGRHGPGNNVFAYFIGPEEFVIEYTGEVELVDDSYPTGGPDDWKWPPGRIDQWGISAPPTDRLKQAQQSVRFAEPAADAAE